MKPDLPKSCDNPKLLTGDIEQLLTFLSYFPSDAQPSLSSPACGGEANAFNQRALKLYAEMHFREEGVPEPPIIPESSGGPEDLYAMVRWCITIWPIWKRVLSGESKAAQRPAGPGQAGETGAGDTRDAPRVTKPMGEPAELAKKPPEPAGINAHRQDKVPGPSGAQQGGRGKAGFTDTEENILEALAKEHMTGPVLLKKAGYDYSSHYRQILSNLVKRGILGNDDTGYFRRNL